jgi:hypothetical protein
VAYWVVNGKQLNEKEYQVYRDKELKAEELAQEEAQRLVGELSQAYKACTGFMEEHPELCHKVGDAEAREHELYLKLRDNLTHADRAPRCEKVREDGTECFSPQMKGYRYCYAHERMLQARPHKLELPAVEDANGVQMAIMRVQKALIDDEISEKKAGLLLYSLQIAASNVKSTTFNRELGKQVVTEMPVVIESPIAKKQVLPLINTDDTDQKKPAVSTQPSARANQQSALSTEPR